LKNKQQIIQMYIHLRKYLTPDEAIYFVRKKNKNTNITLDYLEQVRKIKLIHAKNKGNLSNYHYVY
jgi:hypothetical protein